jgi:hypothetical protein
VLRDGYGEANKKVTGMKQGSMHADGLKEISGDFVAAITMDSFINTIASELG